MIADSVSATSPGDPGAAPPETPALPVATPEPAHAAADGPPLSPEACAQMLKQRFPALFGGAPRPLKLRIQADIRERAPGAFSKAVLSAFLRRHTGRTAYLIALTRATHRFDLDGAPADEISHEHRQAARDELARRRALSESREAQLEAQRRHRAELLRAFEGSSLSTANFCALKGVPPDELDGLLEMARREADARAHPPPAHERGTRPARPARPERARG